VVWAGQLTSPPQAKNKSKGKTQKSKGKAAASTATAQESRAWDFTFAICILPFALFFRHFCPQQGREWSQRLRSCEKTKTAHAKSQSREETQSGSPFFPLRPLRTLRLCVKPAFPSWINSHVLISGILLLRFAS
jgi:hypothetical protein